MKTVSDEYTAKEEATQRKPVELYHIWRDGGENWYYTSGDATFTFDSNSYVPANLQRGSIRYNAQLEAQTLRINASYLEPATLQFISINPVEILWVSVMKLHRDQDPLEADVLFIGQIKNVLFSGVNATINCVGFEHFLKVSIPSWRYQLTCNHQVFDENCAATKVTYKVTTTIALDATGIQLTSSDFALQDDGYYTGGEVVYGDESRTVSYHVGDTVHLIYKMVTLADGYDVDIYPGCDGRAETCRDKFDNILSFLGFPFIPTENPGVRVSW